MASLTLKGIPDTLLEQLRRLAAKERRSLNQQAILILERALADARPSFLEAHDAFVRKYGPLPIDDETFEGLRSTDEGRPSPFEEDPG